MATASGDATDMVRPVMPYVAYAVVLALLGAAGVMFWMGERDSGPFLPRADRTAPPAAIAAPVPSPAPVQALKLPPLPPPPATGGSVVAKPAPAPSPSPAPVPIQSAAPSASALPSPTRDPAAAADDKPAGAKSKCTVDGTWPAEKTDQGKAVQGMLRDLGLYDGTVYGTVGPTTRAAIRKFQASANQPETGEPDQALFEQLRKKCTTP